MFKWVGHCDDAFEGKMTHHTSRDLWIGCEPARDIFPRTFIRDLNERALGHQRDPAKSFRVPLR